MLVRDWKIRWWRWVRDLAGLVTFWSGYYMILYYQYSAAFRASKGIYEVRYCMENYHSFKKCSLWWSITMENNRLGLMRYDCAWFWVVLALDATRIIVLVIIFVSSACARFEVGFSLEYRLFGWMFQYCPRKVYLARKIGIWIAVCICLLLLRCCRCWLRENGETLWSSFISRGYFL